MSIASVSVGGQVLLHEDFESRDPIKLWMDYGKPCAVKYKGLTDEQSFSGKKSFKLDVTFQEDGRYLWSLPSPMPCEGATLSAHLLLGEESTAKMCVGTSFAFPPTPSKGFTHAGRMFTSTQGKWALTALPDLQRHANTTGDKMLHEYTGLLSREDIYPELEQVTIDVRAKRGDRLVLYLDDVSVETEASSGQTAVPNTADRYRPAIARYDAILQGLEKKVVKSKSIIAETQWSQVTQPLKKAMETQIAQIEDSIAEIRAKEMPVFKIWWLYEVRRKLNAVTFTLDNIPSMEEGAKESHLVYIVPSPTDGAKWVLPFDALVPGKLGNAIAIEAARGECEPASFVVKANEKLDGLEVRASDLASVDGAASIPSARIDIKAVKCWYKGATSGKTMNQGKGPRVLTPDLLLNDDGLIKVDYEKHDNFAKLRFGGGSEYRWISNPEKKARVDALVSDFPLWDSPVQLPANLAAGENRQYWIRVTVPKSVPPGEYVGKLHLLSTGVVIDEIDLAVTVPPFDLLPPYYAASIDYHGTLVADGEETIASSRKSETQMLAELKDMVAHGFSNCQHYFPVTDESLRRVLELRSQAGMDNRVLYLKGHGIYLLHWEKKKLETEVEAKVRHIVEVAREYGVQEVYFYGRDEVTGKDLGVQRNAWEAVHRAGGKIFVAGGRDNLALMGDVQDMAVQSGWPDRKEVEGWHKHGHKIFAYNNPQTGIENADIYRRNYGLIMWKYGYDGIADNAYQHTYGLVWNDFDNQTYRNHSMTYPTANGVVDTIGWEGFREGIDDVRYITTLETLIKKAKSSGERSAALADAEIFVEKLRKSQIIERSDLDELRKEIVAHITNLSGTSP